MGVDLNCRSLNASAVWRQRLQVIAFPIFIAVATCDGTSYGYLERFVLFGMRSPRGMLVHPRTKQQFINQQVTAVLLILGMNSTLYELKLRSNSYCYMANAKLR
jgi:hypothetical protein